MTDLAKRLVEGPGSRELSDQVLLALGAKRSVIGHFHGPMYAWRIGEMSYTEPDYPDPTRSVDDALALVPEEWSKQILSNWIGLKTDSPKEQCTVVIRSLDAQYKESGPNQGGDYTQELIAGQDASAIQVRGDNPLPRAICIAVLKI